MIRLARLAGPLLLGTVISLSAVAERMSWLPLETVPALSGPPGIEPDFRQETFSAVRSREEWERIWRLWHPNASLRAGGHVPDAPAIDFEKSMLLVAALGWRPTGGFTVIIQDALDDGSVIQVSVLEVRAKGPGCIVAQTVTYPVAAALIPRSNRPVRFHIAVADLDCRSRRSVNATSGSRNAENTR